MTQLYRVALHGFSEFERNALAFCLKHAGSRVPAYEQAESIAESDFIVADASQPLMDASTLRGARLADTLFVGDKPPRHAVATIGRPLDPERILRALDRLVLQRLAPRLRGAPADAAPSPRAATPPDIPVLGLQDIVEDTTPAAFQHEPIDLRIRDERELDVPAPKPAPRPPPDPALPADTLAPPPASQRPAEPPPAPRPRAMTEQERHAAKEAARRRARAARIAQARRDGHLPVDVLLLDAKSEPDPIGSLLEAFGFRVHRAADIDGAIKVLQETPLAAAFVDLGTPESQGVGGMDLCQYIKRGQLALAGAAPAVMALARKSAASESVRAKLAGCDAYLPPPVRRGDVARALEAADIALPADERRTPR